MGWQDTELPLYPGSYTRTIDPVLYANPHSDGQGPRRVYAAQLQDNPGPGGARFQPPQAIVVTYSDKGGLRNSDGSSSWSSPTLVAENNPPSPNSWYLDKPDMVVSEYTGTRGWVFVAYMRAWISPTVPNPYIQELYVARSSNGGVSFDSPVLVTTGRIYAPQVVVNPSTGRVYCLFVDEDSDRNGTDEIRMSYSDNNGSTWSVPEVGTSGPLKGAENNVLNEGFPGRTIPQARFDHVNNRLIVTWHESEYHAIGFQDSRRPINEVDKLVDATKNFAALGFKMGDYVRNLSNDSRCFVTGVTTTYSLNDTLLIDTASWKSWKVNTDPTWELDFDPGDGYVAKAKDTDIYYTAKYTPTQWLSKVRLNVPLTNDQFQSAVDFNSSGQLMAGYYDRSLDSSNILYELRWIKFDTNGNLIDSGRLPFDPFLSDARFLPLPGFIGDYIDHWLWPYTDSFGPRFHAVFCAVRNNQADIYLGGFQ